MMKDIPVILIADDQLRSIELLEAYLVPEGYEIRKAEDGEEAIRTTWENTIDLVLLDVMMPKIDGFEVCRRIKGSERFRNIPVVMITALTETEDRVKALEAGCDDFISKPVDKHELLVTVKSLLRIKSLHEEVCEAREYAESIINTVREPLIALDQDFRVVTASRSFYEVFNVTPKETVGQLIYDLGNKQWDIPRLRELLETILHYKTSFDNYEVEHDFADIGRRIMLLNARQIHRVWGKKLIILLAIEDVTERKKAEKEREQLLVELQKALANVKTLSKMLPICSYCKKIRDDKGYYEQVETYITKNTDTQFSHGMCPECAKKAIKEFEEFKNKSGH